MVGRPREFDPDQALEAAMHAFWAKGYEATTLSDLMAATGLHKGSLYQAFGDKHDLFVQSLQRYLDDMRQEMLAVANAKASPVEALRALGHSAIDRMNTDCGCPGGCMAINSLVETAPHDAKVMQVLSSHMDFMTRCISGLVAEGQEAGQIGRRRSPETITALMTTFLGGLGAALKGPMSKDEAHRLVDVQFDALL